ncbi:MAG: aquaporin [Candidatus Omnitrophica bacterium]|nr:aquaporin [Candidatus Omnitrophota bacterium]MCB9722066.1 aquaporin [Candidatus Omnitrophota bacterium]
MNVKALIAEFIGTFALVFVAVSVSATDYAVNGATGLLGIAFANGLIIATMVAAVGAISGAHFNPAVTVSMLCTRMIDSRHAVGYILSQCAAAVAAACLVKFCYPADVLVAVRMGTPALAQGVAPAMGLLIEIALTFILVFVIFGVAVDKRAPQGAPLYIGFAVLLDILVGGPLTGAAMNPARYLGPAIMGGGLQDVWLYWLGPLLGGMAAAFVYSGALLEH